MTSIWWSPIVKTAGVIISHKWLYVYFDLKKHYDIQVCKTNSNT